MNVLMVLLATSAAAQPAAAPRSLQAEIDRAPSGGVVELGLGVYVGPAKITRPLTLRGAGVGQTVIQQVDGFESTLGVDVARPGRVRIEDVRFEGTKGAYRLHPLRAGGINLRAGHLTVRRVEFIRIVGYGLGGALHVEGGHLEMSDARIVGCIGNAGNGLATWKDGTVEIERTDFEANDKVPVSLGGRRAVLRDVRFLAPSYAPLTSGPPSDIRLFGHGSVRLERVKLGAGVAIDVVGKSDPAVTLVDTHWVGVGPAPRRLERVEPGSR